MKSSFVITGCPDTIAWSYQMQNFETAQCTTTWVQSFEISSLENTFLSGKCSGALAGPGIDSFLCDFQAWLVRAVTSLTHFLTQLLFLSLEECGWCPWFVCLFVLCNICRQWWLGMPFKLRKNHSESVYVQSIGRVQLCATLWDVAWHAPLSMGFSRRKY